MASGSLASDRKTAKVIGVVEKEFEWYKDEMEEIADEAHTLKACAFLIEYLLTNQNCSYSTMLYPDFEAGCGQRGGTNGFVSGPPALGKNQIVTLLKDIQAETQHNNDEFLRKHDLNYNKMNYDYLFVVSRQKLMLVEANKRDGHGLIYFVEGSMYYYFVACCNFVLFMFLRKLCVLL